MELIIQILDDYIVFFGYICLFQIFASSKFNINRVSISISLLALTITNIVNTLFLKEPYTFLVSYVVLILLFYINGNIGLRKSNIIYLLLVSTIDSFISAILSIIIFNGLDYTLIQDLGLDLFKSLLYFLLYLLLKTRNKQYTIPYKPYVLVFLSICFFVSSFLLLLESTIRSQVNISVRVVLIVSAISIVIVDLLIAFIYIKRENEKYIYKQMYKTNQELLSMQQRYFDELQNSYMHLKSFKHDIKGYLYTIKQLAHTNENEKLYEYIDGTYDKVTNTHFIECDNIYIGALVNHYSMLYSNNIDFTFEYKVKSNIGMKPEHISSLFYNLLENAFEYVHNTKQKSVHLLIKQIDNKLLIKCSNSIDSSTFNIHNILNKQTTKKDIQNHGIGLHNINNIVKTYDGDIEYTCNKDLLHIKIVIHNGV